MKITCLNIILIFTGCLLFTAKTSSQSYHAINGSPYAGVADIYVNPASSVNSAYKWNVNILSTQIEISNSSFVMKNTSLRRGILTDSFNTTNGFMPRNFHANFDASLLNASFKINSKSAFSFGIRGRLFAHLKQMPYYYNDTISTVPGFLTANSSVPYLQGFVVSSGWVEFNFNYARILQQTTNSRLTAGITLGITKGLSGAYSNISRLTLGEQNTTGNFGITGGRFITELSANYDSLYADNGTASNARYFLQNTLTSFNFNIGIEYLFRYSFDDKDDVDEENYDWKIGVSIMDIGKNRYKPSKNAFSAQTPNPSADVSNLNTQISNVQNLGDLRRLMNDYFLSIDSMKSTFKIANPTRMVINVDKNLGNYFYLNGELNINFYSTEPWKGLHTRQLSLATITPRWEKRNIGFYLPVQYNSQGQLWIGGAGKFGPLLLGVHSFAMLNWLRARNQTFNGGFYLMLNVHPFKYKKERGIPCPTW